MCERKRVRPKKATRRQKLQASLWSVRAGQEVEAALEVEAVLECPVAEGGGELTAAAA